MTLPTGTITMAQVNAEIGASPATTITLNNAAVRRLAATATLSPTSPFLTAGSIISMNDLRGRAAAMFATGGTVVNTPTHRIHVFTSPGTFTVSYVFPTANTVDYMIVAGGGGGGGGPYTIPSYKAGGGGGAGGFRLGSGLTVSASPGSYPVVIGGGGSYGPTNVGGPGNNGGSSSALGISSNGGGAGGGINPANPGVGAPGGSGGGGCTKAGGTALPSPNVEGRPGGTSLSGNAVGAGGGGATAQGGSCPSAQTFGGAGGAGAQNPWSPPAYGESPPTVPTSRFFAGGGAGSSALPSPGLNAGGVGGGGNGSYTPYPPTPFIGNSGSINTGGGGGNRGNGGSGIVMIRYPIT